mmetsp:Transcript_22651/g.73655  ORF Transcript_22651/g.73655 Transcript_22651/m.73655 type:complete len:215 (+) Transcript_22651:161-805(+)
MSSIPNDTILNAAFYDFVFSQSDRHGENVFVTPEGEMILIDTRDNFLDFQGTDSVFLPGTFIFERNRVGNSHMFNPSAPETTHHHPQLLLDYRCVVPGGAIGTDFPPRLRAFMERVLELDRAGRVVEELKFPTSAIDANKRAAALVSRCKDLLEKGFEGALKAGLKRKSSQNMPTEGYDWPEPCCRLQFMGGSGYKCISSEPRLTTPSDAAQQK